MTRASDERGVVLILVLAILVLTVGSVYAFERRSLLEVASGRARNERVRAELLARSGIAVGVRAVEDASKGPAPAPQAQDGESAQPQPESQSISAGVDSVQSAWALLGRAPVELPGVGELKVEVVDAGSRINLNALVTPTGEIKPESREFLQAALERVIEELPGRTEEKLYGPPEELADAILDWLDADDTTHLNDDENDVYPSRGGGRPVNRPLWILAELATVPHMDSRLLAEFEHYFTTQPPHPKEGQGGVNPNTAPPHLLGMIYHGVTGDQRLLQADDVAALMRARDEGRLICENEAGDERCTSFAETLGRDGQAFPPLALQSSVFEIKSEAKVGETRACVMTVVDLTGEGGGSTQTLDYRMGC